MFTDERVSMSRLLLRNGSILDGTGCAAVRADLLVIDDRIGAVGPDLAPAPGDRVIDVAGAVVCPGFVDIHTHSDLTLLSSPLAISKVSQGVTTEVIGNCGLGVAPLSGDNTEAVRAAVSYLDLDPDVSWTWTTTSGHLAALEAARPSVNIATLVGHLPLHVAVCGFDSVDATPRQLDRMKQLLHQGFDDGAWGLSTGLVYAPLPAVTMAELVGLGSVCAERNRVFTWHVRDYGAGLTDSVDQALQVARETGCRTQISHLQAVGRRNWPQLQAVLDRIEAGRAGGLRIGTDIYPYLHGNAPLAQRVPAWAQQGPASEWVPRLRDPRIRARIRDAWADLPVGWDETMISWFPDADPHLLGRPVSEIVAERGLDPRDWALDLLAEHGTSILMVAGGRSDLALRTVLSQPSAVVASDGLAMDPDGPTGAGTPHPRSFGCFPRYLGQYRPDGPEGLAEAIARCTSRPADLMGLDRGRITVGAAADLVVFDPDRITDNGGFTDPHAAPDGIHQVIVAGVVVVDDGHHAGARPGRVLRDCR